MRKVAVVGAGKIGSTVVDLLVGSGAYEVLVIDQSGEALARLHLAGADFAALAKDFFTDFSPGGDLFLLATPAAANNNFFSGSLVS